MIALITTFINKELVSNVNHFVEEKEVGHLRNALMVQNSVRYLAHSLHLHRGRVGSYLGVDNRKS